MELKNKSQIQNNLICNNPRCITSTEKYVPHEFYIVNKEKEEYRCIYCDAICKIKGE